MASKKSKSNQISSSSSGGNGGRRGGERGMPRSCRCGEDSVVRTSKTIQNPGRLFHCCPHGFEGDNYHLFKWTDEAMVEEIEDFKGIVSELKEEMDNLQFETRTCETVVSCFEKEMKDIKASVLGCVKEIEEIKNVVDCCEKDVKEVVSEIHSLKNVLVCGIIMAVFYYYFVA